MNSVEQDKLDLKLLDSMFRTSKKTIQEYVREIWRHDCFRSAQRDAKIGAVLDDRGRLIDLYESCITKDAHLVSTLETLYSQILGERYMLARQNEKGKYIKDIEETKKIQGNQFIGLIKGIVDSKFYGYTAFEINEKVDPLTGKLEEINQVERRNILPYQRRIVLHQGTWVPGWSFDDPQYRKNYVLVDSGDIGFFAATTPLILAKNFTMANYVNFSHTYGQPIIHGKTDSTIPGDRDRLANDISSAAENKVIVTGLNDEVDIKTFTMSNSERIFTGLIDMVNKDVSNLIVGSESMAGATQSYVGAAKAHQDVFRDRVEVYREYVENVMNEKIIPRLVQMGYIQSGLEFKYSRRLEMSNQDQINLYNFITDKYEVSADEIEKTFGVIVGKQFNVSDASAVGTGAGGSANGTSNDRRIMTDEEYVRRYGHPRQAANFLRERGK